MADSACTATAYLNGVKANYGTIGVNAKVKRYDCEAELDKSTHTRSIAGWAQDSCKATGIVTTTRITHASPAGHYAHTANRDWENDAEIMSDNCDPRKLEDIAEQLVYSDIGQKLKVIMGGGRREFIGTEQRDDEHMPGLRNDKKNLIEEWKTARSQKGNASYVWNKQGLQTIDIEKTDYLMGLFESDHCHFTADIPKFGKQDDEPTLTEMVEVAIKMLQKEKDGFYLFVEGGRIDLAHHETWARKALTETEEFDKAIKLARGMTSEEDTLIVVTSDHSHTMTMTGYPDRGQDILGIAGTSDDDGLPFLTLSYANGPGYVNTYDETTGLRKDLSKMNIDHLDFEYQATVPLDSETHGGDDVGIYASGPWSHLFVGNFEQNNIPFLIAYAAEIGEFRTGDLQCSSAVSLSAMTGMITGLLVMFIRLVV